MQMAAKGATRDPEGRPTAMQNEKLDPDSLRRELWPRAARDFEYKQNTAQQRNKLDFIFPNNKAYEKSPQFIHIHGGENTGGSKKTIYEQGNLIGEELPKAGIAFASIDYRLFDKGEELSFQRLFQDCKDALRCLAKHAERIGIAPKTFVLFGTSAGGGKALIATLTASDFRPGEVSGPGTDSKVARAISFYGATTCVVEDVWKKRVNRAKAGLIYQANHGLSSEKIKRLVSADLHLKSNSPPILLIHGDSDPTVPVEVSRHLYQKAKNKGIKIEMIEVKNAKYMLKPIKGHATRRSITWNQAQETAFDLVK